MRQRNLRPLADRVPPEVRSRMMAGIRSADTRPEMLLRRGLHAMGWRFRLHAGNLPGKPDLVFPKRRAVIMVHGCFWHGHDCNLFRWPATRTEFWKAKIASNVRRDQAVRLQLEESGWRQCDVWECATKGRMRLPAAELLEKCSDFLAGEEPYLCIGHEGTVQI